MRLRIVFLIFSLLFLSLASRNLSFAQVVTEDDMILPISSASAVTSTPSSVNYELPYPGILPNSPLYPLKVLRDRMVEFLISDPLRKGDFYILEGDKHIYAAILLMQGGSKNSSIAEDTVSKGENYMERAFSQIEVSKKRQEIPGDLIQHLSISLQKHEEQIKLLEVNVPTNVKSRLENDYKRAVNLQKKVDALNLKTQ